MSRLTEYHCGIAVIKNKDLLKEAMEKLAHYEDLADNGKLLELPCGVGDVVYTNMRVSGWYFKEKDKPYKAEIVFVGINGTDNFVEISSDFTGETVGEVVYSSGDSYGNTKAYLTSI